MRSLCLLVALVGVLGWDPHPDLGFDEIGHTHKLQANDNYWMSWEIQPPTAEKPEESIQIALAVNTMGWIGFGISESGGMKGSDIVALWEENGVYRAYDMHSFEYATPELDQDQDWMLVASRTANGETMHIVERVTRVCRDDQFDMSFIDIEQRFIFAFGAINLFVYHGLDNRSTVFVDLFTDDPNVTPPDLPFIEVSMPFYEIPTDLDSYICFNITFDIDRSRFYHVVAIEPFGIIDGFSHHAVTATCPLNDFTYPSPGELGPEGAWSCPGSPSTQTNCGTNYLGWSVGQGIQYFPEQTGLPLGGGIAETIIIQMHNNNPQARTGVRDGAGFRLYYTEELRQYTAILGSTGLTVSSLTMNLPPQEPLLERPTQCPSGCTALMEAPATAFSVMFHMHETGHSLVLHHIRNNVEINRVGVFHWDYNWQGFQEIEPFDIHPGDRFFTECNFNTMNRTQPTYGGDGTQDEMCFAWIYTYGEGYMPLCLGLNTFTGANTFLTYCADRVLPFTEAYIPFQPLPKCLK